MDLSSCDKRCRASSRCFACWIRSAENHLRGSRPILAACERLPSRAASLIRSFLNLSIWNAIRTACRLLEAKVSASASKLKLEYHTNCREHSRFSSSIVSTSLCFATKRSVNGLYSKRCPSVSTPIPDRAVLNDCCRRSTLRGKCMVQAVICCSQQLDFASSFPSDATLPDHVGVGGGRTHDVASPVVILSEIA